ncbi:uncharacterized protein BX664DRAFT_335092 [Halteromyces radiatus]|uniref:uncharacterized protein n=1 Tax=Halteromyces radiatus TaxID=101107 RepID=UPI0022203D71|nr:uncharacterized protein BX664DRAFT_335092 [Halteromyces radiatus]KAI8086174.1 hypothetical protein BX664DRAFT_335092 [Halteromyces radiatus]
MSVLTSVSGFAAFGVLVRTYALGLQKRPLFSNPAGHALAATVFGGVGYFVYNLQERQNALMAGKKDLLLKNRARAEEIAQQQAALAQ